MLNVRLLAITLAVLAVLVPAAYFWHSHQVRNTATILLERADQFEQKEDWATAASSLHKYLRLHPDDVEVHVRLALTFGRSTNNQRRTQRAIELYYRAVGLAPGHVELRRQLAELLIEVRMFPAAEEQARHLLSLEPSDAAGLRVLALALYGRLTTNQHVNPSQVAEALQAALLSRPGDVPAAAALADVFRNHLVLPSQAERNASANLVMDKMILADEMNTRAYLLRHRYRDQYNLPGADADLDRAIVLGPDDADVLLAAAEQAFERKQWSRAAHFYDRAIEAAPLNEQGYLGLGLATLSQNEKQSALDVWKKGLSQVDRDDALELNLRAADVLVSMKRLDEAQQFLATAESTLHALAAKMSRPRRLGFQGKLNTVRAKRLLMKGEYWPAIRLLEGTLNSQQAIENSQRNVTDHVSALMQLGGAYAALKQWDQAATAYEKAILLQPASPGPRMAAARVWAMAGRLDSAIAHYEHVVSRHASPDAQRRWLYLIEARLKRELILPREQQDWAPLRRQLASPPPALAESWELCLLQADFELVQDSAEASRRALRYLQKAERDHADSIRLMQKLVLAYERLEMPQSADRVMAKIRSLDKDAMTATLIHAELLAVRQQYQQAERLLREAANRAPATDQSAVEYALAHLFVRSGEIGRAVEQYRRMVAANPTSSGMIRELLDLLFEQKDLDGAARWEDALRQLEGSDGTLWKYYRVRRFIEQTDDDKDPRFVEAAALQEQIEARRPSWATSHLLKGMIAQRQGKLDEAIAAFQRTIGLGERHVRVFEQLIALLYQAHRIAEAQQYLSRLQDHVVHSQRMLPVAVAVAAKLDARQQAVQLARQAVDKRPQDAMARVWYGHALLLDGQVKEAEAVFRQAVTQSPADLKTWSGLFSYYLRTDDIEAARKTIQQLVDHVPLEPAQKSFVLAQGHELVGDAQSADTHYRQAQRLDPDDVAIQMRGAAFLLRRDITEAEKSLRRVLKLEAGNGPARRALAAVLAMRGGENEWKEAQSLLETVDVAAQPVPLDQRLQALLLSQRGGTANLEKARRLLEQVIRNPQQATPGDYLLLARLYEAEGKLQAARETYVSVVSRSKPNPTHITLFVDMLIRREQWADAEIWLRRLTTIDPQHAALLGLRARLLHGRGRASDEALEQLIRPLTKKLADLDDNQQLTPQDRIARQAHHYLEIGNLYTIAELHRGAELWFRKLTAVAPAAYQPLAKSLAAQGRAGEAIQLCLQAAKTDKSAHVAKVLAAALSAGSPTPEEFSSAEPFFQQAMRDHPDDADLLFAVGILQTSQRRTDEAAELFRRVHKLRPRHILTLNNLATVLSELPDMRREALQYIDRAIGLAGPHPALLDTRGMLALHDGDPQLAVTLLKEATASLSSDPRYYFHLALAYRQSGSLDLARDSLERARKDDLERKVLTSTDRKLLVELDDALNR